MDSDEDIRKVPLNESDQEVKMDQERPSSGSPIATVPEHVDKLLDKKAQKKLKKEQKAEEKRLKKQEREAQKSQGGGGGVQFMRKSFNHLSNMLAPNIIKKNNQKPIENAVSCKVTLLDGSEYSTSIDVGSNISMYFKTCLLNIVSILQPLSFNTHQHKTQILQKYAYGQHLVDKVLDHLNLVEKEYFSLTFTGKRNILVRTKSSFKQGPYLKLS